MVPKVSIIMSNYNGMDFIKDTIDSVLCQTFKDFEFIIIDDCSTDESRNIIDSYQDKRIKKIYFENNEHMCYAFNYAINISNGEYLARIDSDDTWEPEKLEKQVKYMDKHGQCGACFTLVNVLDENNKILSEKETDRINLFSVDNMSNVEWLRYFYFYGSCLCHPSVVMRKSVINDVGIYNYSLRQIQDYDLWVRIVKKKYDIYILQEQLTNYRWFISGKNASAPSKEVNTRSRAEFTYVLSHYFDDIDNEAFMEAFRDDLINRDIKNQYQIECEKALLLLKPVFCGYCPKMGGVEKMIKLIQNNATREVLRKEYNITQKSVYELMTSPIFLITKWRQKLSHLKKKEIF